MGYKYRVLKDYHDNEFDFNLVEGEIVTDEDFHEPDITARLIGRGVIEAADQEAEAERLDGDHLWAVDDDKKAAVQKRLDAREAQRNKKVVQKVLNTPDAPRNKK